MRTAFAISRTHLTLVTLLISGTICTAMAAPNEKAEGKRLFDRECAACHQIGPGAISLSTGPTLNGIIGMPGGDEPGFAYSDANRKSALIWTTATLDAFIADPQARMPGTAMAYPGLKTPGDRQALVAYVNSFDAHGASR